MGSDALAAIRANFQELLDACGRYYEEQAGDTAHQVRVTELIEVLETVTADRIRRLGDR